MEHVLEHDIALFYGISVIFVAMFQTFLTLYRNFKNYGFCFSVLFEKYIKVSEKVWNIGTFSKKVSKIKGWGCTNPKIALWYKFEEIQYLCGFACSKLFFKLWNIFENLMIFIDIWIKNVKMFLFYLIFDFLCDIVYLSLLADRANKWYCFSFFFIFFLA